MSEKSSLVTRYPGDGRELSKQGGFGFRREAATSQPGEAMSHS